MKKGNNLIIQNHNEHRKLVLVRLNQKQPSKKIEEYCKNTLILGKVQNKQDQNKKQAIEEKIQEKIGKNIIKKIIRRKSSLDLRILTQNNQKNKIIFAKNSIRTNSLQKDTQHSMSPINNMAKSFIGSLFDFTTSHSCNEIQELIKELIKQMIQQMFLYQSSSVTYIIKKERFHQIIKCLIQTSYSQKKWECKNKAQNKDRIMDVMSKISKFGSNCRFKDKSNRLVFQAKTVSIQYSSQQFNKQKINNTKQYQQMLKSKGQIQKQIMKLTQIRNSIKSQYNYLQQSKVEEERKSCELQQSNKRQTQKYNKLIKDINKLEMEMQTITKKKQEIMNFVCKQQSKQILKQVSRQYKNIQSDLFQYAVYLQSNQMANNPNFELHPFLQMEKQLLQQIKTTNKNIIQNQSLSLQIKQKQMRDIIIKIVDFYKKKDSDMITLMNFKTKYIRQYVEKMKKWLSNWELKQEFLNNLRKQFAADTKLSDIHLCETCKQNKDEIADQLISHFSKIQENYKMGNSFY